MALFKTVKVTFNFMVIMVTVYKMELWNAHQKIPHNRKSREILTLKSQSFKSYSKEPLVGGGGGG